VLVGDDHIYGLTQKCSQTKSKNEFGKTKTPIDEITSFFQKGY
jgi:hypothetical protein